MTTPFLVGDLARDEGLRLEAYPDPISPRGRELCKVSAERCREWRALPAEPWTIGYGHTGPHVHEGLLWTPTQARAALADDVAKACRLLDVHAPWWRRLSDLRQDVLANMVFNMGWGNGARGLSSFRNTLAAMQRGDYTAAADGMLRSAWAGQVGARARRLAEQMRTGRREAP